MAEQITDGTDIAGITGITDTATRRPARADRGEDVPRSTTLALPGDAGSIAAAREHARTFLDRVQPALPGSVIEDAVLAISELVTNVVRHAPGPCTLRLEVDERAVHIAVSDTSRELPRLRSPHAGMVGGFGLPMVFSLAHQVETRVHDAGKTVSVSLSRDRGD